MSEEKKQVQYLVRYEVEGFGERQAGPYDTVEEAFTQRDDIAGFEGVSGARVWPCLVDPESGQEKVCGKISRRVMSTTHEGCCDDCFESMMSCGDFSSEELEAEYPLRQS